MYQTAQEAIRALYEAHKHSGGWRAVADLLDVPHAASVWRVATGKGHSTMVVNRLIDKGYLADQGNLVFRGVGLTVPQWEYVVQVGQGNYSKGMRLIIERARRGANDPL